MKDKEDITVCRTEQVFKTEKDFQKVVQSTSEESYPIYIGGRSPRANFLDPNPKGR